MELDNKFIEKTKLRYGYKDIDLGLKIANKSLGKYISAKYSCSDNIEILQKSLSSDIAIVTGFGPTNSPTAGTLSVIFRALAMQKETGIFTSVIISDLGAWNSRNLQWNQINETTDKFVRFICKRGFDLSNGIIRTHKDMNNLVLSGIISKFLIENDFKSNKEATDMLYDKLNLRGSFFSIMIDGLYTVSDILYPLFYNNKKHSLVLCGIEEHYFSTLAKIVLKRSIEQCGTTFFNDGQTISSLFTKLVGGLYPYPKMSKSIPDSAINLTDTNDDIARKILYCSENDPVILQMIQLVSDWAASKINYAEEIFNIRNLDSKQWYKVKAEYTDYFIEIAEQWKNL